MRDADFIARVRRHKPSALLPLVASYASTHIESETWFRKPVVGFGTPWALAEIVRVSLSYSNEYRQDANLQDVTACNDAFNQLDDPELVEGYQGPLAGFFHRQGEQLDYQRRPLNQLARSTALFADTSPSKQPQVLRPGWDLDLLGGTFPEMQSAGMMLWAACKPNSGRFNPAWLEQDNMRFVSDRIAPSRLVELWRRNLVTTSQAIAAVNGRPEPSAWRRFEFNPLLAHPVIEGLGADWLIPVPGVLIRRLSPLGVYYAGLARWGKAFADDLGDLFQQYVGRQLRSIPGATVHEVADNSHVGSVDFVVEFPQLLLLVEVKAVRPTEAVRAGTFEAAAELSRMLAKGLRQLDREAHALTRGESRFDALPTDLPMIGLLITMEDFHVVNSPFHRQTLLPAGPSSIPLGVASVGDLEDLLSVTGVGVDTVLREAAPQDGARDVGVSIHHALLGHARGRNMIIDRAFSEGIWD